VILEEAPPLEESATTRKQQLLVLSAKTEAALESATTRLVTHLEQHADVNLADVAFTLQAGRKPFKHRRAVVCSSLEEARTALETKDAKRTWTAKLDAQKHPLVFMFPGQGAQHVRMAAGLYQSISAFRKHVDECAELLRPYLNRDLREAIYPANPQDERAARELKQTALTQPALFVVEYALAQMWMEWGIKPQAFIGHSIGEYVAACLSKVLTLEDALTLVAARGRLMQELPEGAMLAVALPSQQVQYLLGNKLQIAAINTPQSCVVSGATRDIDALEQSLREKNVAVQRLQTSHAFHSEMVKPILKPFGELIKTIKLNSPTLPYVSNLTGKWITEAQATDPNYWVNHLRQTVRFAEGIEQLTQEKDWLWLEVGPGRTLSTLVTQTVPQLSQKVFSTLGHPKERGADEEFALTTLGRLWLHGVDVDWNALHVDERCRRVVLPTYPFERKKCWIDPPVADYAGAPEHDRQAAEHAFFTQSVAIAMNVQPKESPRMSEPEVSTPSQPERRPRILDTLKTIVNDLTGIAPSEVDVHATFFELGVSSLLLIQAGQSIKSKFGVEVSLIQFFDDLSTLDALATYIDAQLPPEALEPVAVASTTNTRTAATTLSVEPLPQENSSPTINAPPAIVSPPPTLNRSEAFHGGALEQIVAEQLRIMSQQIELLRNNGAATAASHTQTVQQTAPTATTQPSVKQQSGHTASATNQRTEVQQTTTSNSNPVAHTDAASGNEAEFTPYNPVTPNRKAKLTERQQSHLETLIARYTKRTRESKKYVESYRPFLADPRVAAGFNLLWKDLVYPIIVERSQGSKVWDIDGNEYVDLAMGFGVNLFGHSPSFITDALQEQLRQGVQVGPQSNLAGPVAELICELTGRERVIFCNSGTEAVMTALRLARTVTGRTKVAFFTGSYHGSFDGTLARTLTLDGQRRSVPLAPGVMHGMIEDVLVLDYGSAESLEILNAHRDELAAVLVEPVQSRRPHLQPREYLHELRRLTAESGTALIFDEVITGFRVHPGGAQAWFGVEADMAVYGKVLGGGMPIGAIAGTPTFMNALDGGTWRFGDASIPRAQQTFFAGTFCKHPLAMSAAWAVLNYMKKEGGAIQEGLNQRTAQMVSTLENYFQQEQLPIRIANFSSLFFFHFPREQKFTDLFFYHMVEKGIYIWEGRTCFLSTAHTDEDINRVVETVKRCVAEMREADMLPPSPQSQQNDAGQQTVLTAKHSANGNGHAPHASHATTEEDDPAESVEPQRQKRASTAPLTDAQKQLWLAAQMGDDASRAYNESITLHMRGEFNLRAMQQAIQQLVARHDSLRTTFSPQGDVQHVAPALILEIPFDDLTTLDAEKRDEEARRLLSAEAQHKFDLMRGPLMRARIVKLDAQYHLLVLTVHHIAADGRSFGVMMRELRVLYGAEAVGASAELAEPVQFNEYAERQACAAEISGTVDAEDYWLKQFAGDVPALDLPSDYPRPPVKSYRGARRSTTVSASVCRELKSVSAQHGATLFMTLLASFKVLLHRLSGQDDIVVGVPAAAQLAVGDDHIVGHCLNFLPLRSKLIASQPFAKYLKALKRVVLEGYEHQNFSFGALVEKLNLPWNPSRTPLVSTGFNLDRGSARTKFADLSVELVSNHTGSAKFDLDLNVVETDGELQVDCEYSTDLFEPQTIQRWLGHWTTLLENIAANPRQPISDLPLMDEAERQRLIIERNRTAQKYPQDACLQQLFEAQAEQTPDAVALIFEDAQMTYGDLNRRANQLAHYLRAEGVGAEVLVGICMERSADVVVAMLGVLKAGGAYVPLNPSYPQARLAFMVDETQIRLLLTQQRLREMLPRVERTVSLDADWESIAAQQSVENPLPVTTPDNLAYAIYTSGADGQPHAILVAHRGVCNNVSYSARLFDVKTESRLLQLASFDSDNAVLEIFMALTTGASLYVGGRQTKLTGPDLTRLLREQAITTAVMTPSLAALLSPKSLPRLQTVSVGGESCSGELAAQWSAGRRFLHCYGATETTIYASAFECREDYEGDPPLGAPIANTQIYLLDPNMQPVPVGVPGEIYVGGVGVGRGYLGHPELTAERFVPDAFSASAGARLYRTGDRARFLPDGHLQFLGRLDGQVKFKGLRVELGEIETVLKRYAAVGDAVVMLREDTPDDRQLVAYVIAAETTPPNAAELRQHLKELVPAYMVPMVFVMLERWPLTSDGRVDRQALPAPEDDSPTPEDRFAAPRNPVEEELARIWVEVLGVERVGVDDNFLELGGHSLLATKVVSRVRESFRVEIPLRQLFETPTVAGMAITVARSQVEQKDTDVTNIPVAARGDADLQQLLAQLDGLSESEVQALLAEETRLGDELNSNQ
jgi:amino acid adenylation domain-containing protein